jgi:regulator of protease activity HflC (stomatin/prohibitin superfamily)
VITSGHHPRCSAAEVITRDNAVIITNAIAFIKVTDPIKAVYGRGFRRGDPQPGADHAALDHL